MSDGWVPATVRLQVLDEVGHVILDRKSKAWRRINPETDQVEIRLPGNQFALEPLSR